MDWIELRDHRTHPKKKKKPIITTMSEKQATNSESLISKGGR